MDKLCGKAVARLHISSTEFYFFTPVELYYSMKEYSEMEELKIQLMYESMRIQTYYLVNIQLDRKNKIKDPKKLIPFVWDKEEVVHQQSAEEMKQILMGIATKHGAVKKVRQ